MTNHSLKAVTILIGFALTSLFALQAQAHQCRFLKPDARNLCLAKKENARYYCRYIKDADQQRFCYAFLNNAPQQCEIIKDETLKEQCRTEAQTRLDEALAQQKAAEEAKAAKEAEKAAQEAQNPPKN
jgi:hypothetical protein